MGNDKNMWHPTMHQDATILQSIIGNCSQKCRSLEKKQVCPDRSYGFVLNLRIKNGVGYTHKLMTVIIVTYQHKVRFFAHITSYILE
jgi:hypothetical protein